MGLRVVNKVYTDLEGRTGDSIQGNYLDISIVQYDVEYDSKVCLSDFFSVLKKGNTFILTSGSWFDLIGAFNGANIEFKLKNQGNSTTTTIDYVNTTELTVVDDGNYSDDIYSLGFFQVTDAPELFEFDFNLVQNSLAGTKFSVIDNETQRFSAVLVNALIESGSADNFIQLGFKSGGSTMTSTIARIADVDGNKRYTIIINYKNWALFDKELYKADDCIGDYVKIKATPQRGNDNVFIEVVSKNQGDTGYEDEALNGGVAEFTFTSISWEDDSANIMTAMDFSQPSNFSIEIAGTFSADIKYGVKLFRLPLDGTEYLNLPTDVEDNLSVCMNDVLIADGVPTAVTGNLNVDGAAFDISGFDVTDNVTSITAVGKITPNAAMISLLTARGETDRQYKLEIVCDDTTKGYRDTNTVNVLCEFTNAIKNTIPLGAWADVTDFEMIDIDSTVLTGTPDLLLESNNRMNVTFTLPKDINKDNPWQSLTGQMVAERTNGERFLLESFVYDISELSAAIPTDILAIDYSQTRGKRLPSGSLFNEVTFELYPTLDTGTDFGIKLTYGFRVGFETWIALPDASDYFAGDKTNNWYTYSSDAAWQLKFELVLTHEDGVYTNEQDFGVLDYDSSSGVNVLTYKDPDAVAITYPYSDQITEITWTFTTAAAAFLGNEFATFSVRNTDGITLGEIDTVSAPTEDDNPLTPISGETQLKLTVAGKVMTMVCLFDPSLVPNEAYTFSYSIKGDT